MHKLLTIAFACLVGFVHADDKPSALFTSEPEVVSTGHQFAEGMAFDADGHFYFTDVPAGKLFKVDAVTGEKSLIDGDTGRANGIGLHPEEEALMVAEFFSDTVHRFPIAKDGSLGESKPAYTLAVTERLK